LPDPLSQDDISDDRVFGLISSNYFVRTKIIQKDIQFLDIFAILLQLLDRTVDLSLRRLIVLSQKLSSFRVTKKKKVILAKFLFRFVKNFKNLSEHY
jgi:hypothetical protein